MTDQVQTSYDLNRYNVGLVKIMQNFIDDLKQNSNILVRNQEDCLTFVEYEELVKADLQICEDMLDILLTVVKEKRKLLQSQVDTKKSQCAVLHAIHTAFSDLDSLKTKLNGYRTKLRDGDYSFLKPQISADIYVVLRSSDADDLPIEARVPQSENNENDLPNDLTSVGLATTEDLYRPRPRPQFSSEIARQIVADLDKEKMRSTCKQPFLAPSGAQQNLKLTDSNTTKFVPITKIHHTAQRYDDEKIANFVHIASCTSGCGSLDGSVSDFGSEQSNQNGIRAHSPVHRIPQPNFDDTGLDEFDQVDPMEIQDSKPTNLFEVVRDDTTVSKISTGMESILKITEYNIHAQNTTSVSSSSSYHGPQRPKFTSSVGQMYNRD